MSIERWFPLWRALAGGCALGTAMLGADALLSGEAMGPGAAWLAVAGGVVWLGYMLTETYVIRHKMRAHQLQVANALGAVAADIELSPAQARLLAFLGIAGAVDLFMLRSITGLNQAYLATQLDFMRVQGYVQRSGREYHLTEAGDLIWKMSQR